MRSHPDDPGHGGIEAAGFPGLGDEIDSPAGPAQTPAALPEDPASPEALPELLQQGIEEGEVIFAGFNHRQAFCSATGPIRTGRCPRGG